MGFRFRKSIKILPGLRINLNKKSTSVTFGSKGVHYTVNNKGKKTGTIGIPGTGISYTATSNAKKKKNTPPEISNTNFITPIIRKRHVVLMFAVFALFIGALSTIPSNENDGNINNIIVTSEAESIEETAPLESSAESTLTLFSTANLNVRSGPGTNYDIIGKLSPGDAVSVISVDGNWSQIQFDPAPAYVSSSYLSEAYSIETTAADEGPMVWISYSGKKYHSRSNCSNMKGPSQVPLKQAVQMGKTPCQKCY